MSAIITDVLIIGTGAAGLRAAIEATSSEPVNVLVVSKSLPGKSGCSPMAEGGINAVLKTVDADDSIESHFKDTIEGGDFLNNEKLVSLLVRQAPEIIDDLEKKGALFDRTKEGKINQKLFAAQSHKRTCFLKDATGHEITTTLLEQFRTHDIEFKQIYIHELLLDDGEIAGATGIDVMSGNFVLIRAKAIIIASGGSCRMYKITTNSYASTGDGIAMAARAGATCVDMEMIQFHPTAMVYPESAKGILVTEAVRSLGAQLLNKDRETFMEKYHEKKDMAPRDVVSRAIFNEIRNGCGTKNDAIYLSLKGITKDIISKMLPSMQKQFRDFAGIEITEDVIEVAPAAHHIMGGLLIDDQCNTTIPGLFACGEATGGIHGANRLGGNALLDTQVFGRIAGQNAAHYSQSTELKPININAIEAFKKSIFLPLTNNDGIRAHEMRYRLKDIMWRLVGIERNKQHLNEAVEIIRQMREYQISKLYTEDKRIGMNFELIKALETYNLVFVAEMVARSALFREESRGAHFRTDFPQKNDSDWRCSIAINFDDEFTLDKTPVQLLI